MNILHRHKAYIFVGWETLIVLLVRTLAPSTVTRWQNGLHAGLSCMLLNKDWGHLYWKWWHKTTSSLKAVWKAIDSNLFRPCKCPRCIVSLLQHFSKPKQRHKSAPSCRSCRLLMWSGNTATESKTGALCATLPVMAVWNSLKFLSNDFDSHRISL